MNVYRWLQDAAAWVSGNTGGGGGARVPLPTIKAAADCVVSQSHADIGILVTRLTNGEITVAELEPLMQGAIKRGILANTALAHGGYDNLTTAMIERAEKQTLEQFDYLRNRVLALQSRVRTTGQLAARDSKDLISYSNAFRSVYENERVEAQKGIGHTEGKRVLANVAHCSDCEEAAALDWVPIDELPPIGDDQCKNSCHCVVITRKGEA